MLVRHGRVGDWRLSDAEFMASFRLPTASDKHEVLKAKNPIPEEGRLVFDETSHTYAFDGVAVPCSVTTLVHRFAGKFGPGGALAGMKSRDSWEWNQQQYLKNQGKLANQGGMKHIRCKLHNNVKWSGNDDATTDAGSSDEARSVVTSASSAAACRVETTI